MDYLVIQATNGLVIGIIYALVAVGVTLIFSILKIVNFAHGDLYMLGGYTAYYAITLAGISPFAAIFIAMTVVFGVGVVLERLLLAPLYSERTERKDEYGIIVTFGLAFFLRNMAIIGALETSKWDGTRGQYAFSTSHDPDWTYHQFVEAPLYLLQYDKVGQKPEDAPVIWPQNLATVPYLYKKPQ